MYLIPTHHWSAFEDRFSKMVRKAVKLEVEVPTYMPTSYQIKISSVSNRFPDGHKRPFPIELVNTWQPVEVKGSAPTINGWTFAARLEPVELEDDSIRTLFKTAPGFDIDIPNYFRSASHKWCDHCRTTRYRKTTYVVHNAETDDWAQVGRTCVKDYLGWNHSPDSIATYLENFYALERLCSDGYDDGFWGSNAYAPKVTTPRDFLQTCIACAKVWGFVTKGQAYNDDSLESTASTAYDILLGDAEGLRSPAREQQIAYLESIRGKVIESINSSPNLFERLDGCMDWAKSHIDSNNNFLQNLAIAASIKELKQPHMGLLAAAYPSYMRAMGKEAERAKEGVKLADSKHVGEVKERLVFKVKLLKSIGLPPSQWSCDPVLYRFLSEAGDLLVWFASSSKSLDDGENYTITGTVKKHDEYNNVKQTILTRVKIHQE